LLKIEIVRIKNILVNLEVRNEYLFMRWIKGILVMLEKSLGKTNVKKLKVILLLEVDFNVLYKTIFNSRIMPALEVKDKILYEIIATR
jgi:hypothetical protein